jgi:hypothetical protein
VWFRPEPHFFDELIESVIPHQIIDKAMAEVPIGTSFSLTKSWVYLLSLATVLPHAVAVWGSAGALSYRQRYTSPLSLKRFARFHAEIYQLGSPYLAFANAR